MSDDRMISDASPGSVAGRGHAQSQAQADAAALKLTRGTSCVLCQQRKVRCDKNKPCANCVKAKVECRVVPPQPPRRRKKRLQERDLIDRLKKYESLLAENGVKFDSIGQDLRAAPEPNPEDVDDLENDFEGLRTSPSASASPGREQDERKAGMWFSIHKEFRASEQLLHDSSEEEAEGPLIHRAYDRMFGNQDGFPFIIGGAPNPITHLHPSAIHIFQLWQIYIDNINPLLKITHIPTVQPQVLQAASQLDKAPSNIEALMFGMYLMAITSLEDRDVQSRFQAPKKVLIGRFTAAVQQALINASFMRVNDSLVLQAFVLYLFAVRWFTDPRQVFCLIGIAVRIAERMGLHRDPGGHGLPPFEVEQRRRLWWTLVGYDRRLGEMTGSTVTALSSGGDCKPPLNVNDSDLHTEGKDMPMPHNGPTEMLFALTRAEIAMAVASNSNRDSHKIVPKETQVGTPNSKSGAKEPAMIHLAGQDSPPYTLEGFCAHIEGTYLQHCDPKIPLHFFTLTMTRQHLCKMRIIGFLVRMHDAEAMPLKDIERDSLFLQATQMIEYDNVVQSSESLQPFKWYSMHYFPFPAYMFLVQELRTRSAGPMVERAWDAITANHELRGLLNNLHNPMHMAFGNLFVKSWDSHEAAQRNAGKHVSAPHFINVLRERSEKRRQARAENRDEPVVERPVELPLSAAQPGSAPASVAATSGGEAASMMTPPQAQSQHSADTGDDNDMDWSYLVAGYNDVANYHNFGNYGSGFGPPPMGPTGANMPGMGPGMGGGGGMAGGMAPLGGMGGMAMGSAGGSPNGPAGRGRGPAAGGMMGGPFGG